MDSTAIGTVAGLVTLIIVAVTAFAALRQMRQNQMANELVLFTTFVREVNEPEMSGHIAWIMGLAERMKDADYRERFFADSTNEEAKRAIAVLQFFERSASLVIASGLSEHLLFYEYVSLIIGVWENVLPAYPSIRNARRGLYAGRAFEHLAMRAKRYEAGQMVRDYERLLRDPRTVAMDAAAAVDADSAS